MNENSSLFSWPEQDMEKIFSVSDFHEYMKALLSERSWRIQGEVSGYHVSKQGWVMFDLKDEKSRMACFMLRDQLDQDIFDGAEIVVTGKQGIYVPAGKLSFRVWAVRLVGEGALRKAFEMTKKKLESEGLFEERFKKVLPRIPQTLGIITSRDAAAYTDVIRILNNRWSGLDIYFYDVLVQGEGAPLDIVRALSWFREHQPIDVLLVVRGGGSLEDLQAFNSEAVCRAVFASRVPVVCGIGHERDVTLVDYVCDVRASTPSNAAELVTPSRDELLGALSSMRVRFFQILALRWQEKSVFLRKLVDRITFHLERRFLLFDGSLRRFVMIGNVLTERASDALRSLSLFQERFHARADASVIHWREKLARSRSSFRLLHPMLPLTRGYSLTRNSAGKIIRSTRGLQSGALVETRLADGTFSSRIISLSLSHERKKIDSE